MGKSRRFDKNVYCVFNNGKCIGVYSTARLAIETCDVFPGSVIKMVSWSLICRLLRDKSF